MQREQHVGVTALLLAGVRPVGAAGFHGGVQEEGRPLGRGGTELALVLELYGGGGVEGGG